MSTPQRNHSFDEPRGKYLEPTANQTYCTPINCVDFCLIWQTVSDISPPHIVDHSNREAGDTSWVSDVWLSSLQRRRLPARSDRHARPVLTRTSGGYSMVSRGLTLDIKLDIHITMSRVSVKSLIIIYRPMIHDIYKERRDLLKWNSCSKYPRF